MVKPYLTWYNILKCIEAFDRGSISGRELCKLLYITELDLPKFIAQFKLQYRLYTSGVSQEELDILLAKPYFIDE